MIFNVSITVLLLFFKLSFGKMEKSTVVLEAKTVLPKTAKFCSRKFPCLYLLHSKANKIVCLHDCFLVRH